MTTTANAGMPVTAEAGLPINYSNELEGNLSAFISNLENEASQEEADEVLKADETEVTDSAVASEETATEVTETPEVKSGLDRLATREAEIRKLEQDYGLKLKDFDAKVAEAVKSKLPDFSNKNPEDILSHFGMDPELAMKEMMFRKVKDDSPLKAKLAADLKDYHTKKEITQLKADLERRDAERAQAEYFQSIHSGARKYVDTVDEKETPNFAKVAKTKPDLAHGRIMRVIITDAQERLARGESGDPLSYAEAAKVVEADLKDLAEIFMAGTAPTKASTVAAKTLKVTKPTVKPVAEPTIEDLINAGIESGKKTYYLEEQRAGRVK